MHKARAFFYICAGLFLLALSYHLGARSAGAQAGAQFRVLSTANPLAIESCGQVFYLSPEGGWVSPSDLPPVPVSSLVAGNGDYVASDGTGWHKDGYTGAWHAFPYPCAPVPAQRETFGSVKARYR